MANEQKNEQKNAQTPNVGKPVTIGYAGPLYGPVTFRKPEQASIYAGRNGSKSTMAITATVPVLPHGLLVEAALWLRQTTTADGNVLTCEAAVPRGIKPWGETEEARDIAKDEFCAHIELAAIAWDGYENAYNAAVARLTGAKPAGVAAFKSKRPNLVLPNGERKPQPEPNAPTA